ncbi:bifunctional diaminohydroxyphosphoribosylaminopyrimidine deaminase/5-amino-6-(5-phosphoribosylamino)uracil reductase RibD [Desulfonatronovibrio magnus]|uniref:bifunctional diaminohydroxyphosphoribosylaminopyrimidine deaminase/5-amino-6-(5-phosphoribosylamino)uracil reductase RibD n=1 Tax=Desulfonatronovibrio magnus TaxID=698827 RepID=UPI0005EBBE8B|nr:bifunctional diaminohydroxyphosphoribosylaminopyrimidine deaminase/5-amino-6-(5-phosphoribosylamino)uracil reductase RibD [Desulfonatronovibrio magnus]
MNQSDFMLKAVSLAMKGKGRTAPNPCVGAVIAAGNEIVGQGFHRACGENHAEVEAINHAILRGYDLSQCVLYVTLEPCNHFGKTPPCTQAILKAGIRHVVIGALDPNPHVSGGGADFLARSGVHVQSGIEEQKCQDLIADFVVWNRTDRAYLYLKMASTLDGRIATSKGHSQWVTSDVSRKSVHELRSKVGAVIVGGNTFYQDNPRLTCRDSGAAFQPLAIIVTSRLPEPDMHYYLLTDRPRETIFWTDQQTAQGNTAGKLKELGCEVIGLDRKGTGLDLAQGLSLLRQKNIYHALCEGGGLLGLSFLRAKLADELWYYMAMKILGDNQAKPVFDGNTPQTMDEALSARLAETRIMGNDILLKLFLS